MSLYQPSSTRLTKIQLLVYPIETKILNNNNTDNRFVIITDEIDPDMLMDTNNYSVIRGKTSVERLLKSSNNNWNSVIIIRCASESLDEQILDLEFNTSAKSSAVTF